MSRQELRMWLGVLALVAGCGDDGTGPAADAGGQLPVGDDGSVPSARPAPFLDTLKFGACDVEELVEVGAECATVEVPAYWSEPDGDQIELFVWRVLQPGSSGQMWLLSGGPGSASWSYSRYISGKRDPDVEPLAANAPGLDFYALDFRGTGKSSYLMYTPVDVREAGIYTTTHAAQDLAALIDVTRVDDQPVFVTGVSYGTEWAQRYLQIRPNDVTGVVLDSVVSPLQRDRPLNWDRGWHDVAVALMDVCAADPTCSGKLGADPLARFMELYSMIDAGHCPEVQAAGLARDDLRYRLGQILDERPLRRAIPAVVHRYLRCNEEDIAALIAFQKATSLSEAADGNSNAVLFNIELSEDYEEPPPTRQQVEDHVQTLLVSQATGITFSAAYDAWPRYPRDEYAAQVPETDVPILMLAGELDARTTAAEAADVAGMLGGAHQTLAVIPHGVHGQLRRSPLASDPAKLCGAIIMKSFLADPLGQPDTSCLADVTMLDFSEDPQLAMELFGVPGLWETR